jgi:hypothetical protein
MEGTSTVVHFLVKDAEGVVEFTFPDGSSLIATAEDVARSTPLQDMIDSAAGTSLTLPSSTQCMYLKHWAEAVQPGSGVLNESAGRLAQCLVVRCRSLCSVALHCCNVALMESQPSTVVVLACMVLALVTWCGAC